MKTLKVFFNIMSVICFIYGIAYIFTLVFIPIGIYCFISAKRFSYKAEHLFDTFALSNKDLRNHVIFVSIACFPLGLLSIIPYYLLTSNKIKVSELKLQDKTVEVAETKDLKSSDEETKVETVETEEEKLEKFKKLQNFKEKGIITDEELEMARVQLFGDEKK